MNESDKRSAEDPVRGMGRGMLWVFWILVLVGGTLLFSARDEGRERAARTPETFVHDDRIEVRIERNRAGHYVTDGTIEGRRVTFLLDTGATAVVVPAADADRLGLERGTRIPIRTASGVDHAWLTRIDRLEIGRMTWRDVEGAIAPGLDGTVLLGMSALGRVEMAQRDGVLVLTQRRTRD